MNFLYTCSFVRVKILCFTLTDEYRLKMSENREMRRIFAPKKEAVDT
jgi:hypothetical protein